MPSRLLWPTRGLTDALWRGVAIASLSAGLAGSGVEPTSAYQLWNKEVQADFLKAGYRLVIHPVQLPESKVVGLLYVESESTKQLIMGPQDLKGLVRLKTGPQALAFCRLFTDHDQAIPLFFNKVIYDDNILGPREVTSDRKRDPKAFWAIAKDLYKTLGMAGPKATRAKQGGFHVERNLLAYNRKERKVQVYRSLEIVGTDGAYSHQVKKVITAIEPRPGILEPLEKRYWDMPKPWETFDEE